MEEASRETWNKKRIILTLLIIALLLTGVFYFRTKIFGENIEKSEQSVQGVWSRNNEPDFRIGVQEAVKGKIESIRQQVLGLNMIEIASSSPQVQKIINDIKSLEQYPSNQIKEICKKVCGL